MRGQLEGCEVYLAVLRIRTLDVVILCYNVSKKTLMETSDTPRGFEICLHSRGALVWVLNAINALIPEAIMHVTDETIKLKGLDSSHIGLFDVHLDLKQLAGYTRCSNPQGFDIGFTTRVFKSFVEGFVTDRMTLKYEEDDMLQMVEEVVDADEKEGPCNKRHKARDRNECKMRLVDLDVDAIEIPPLEHTAKIDISPKEWRKLVKDFQTTGETIILECDAEKMVCETKDTIVGERRRVLMHDREVSIDFGAPSAVRMKLSLRHIALGCDKILTHDGDRMQIELGQISIFHYYLGQKDNPECRISYYLAPQIDDD